MTRVVRWSREMESLGPCVVAMGVFDGVHAGHRSLLDAARAEAARRRVPTVAVTFDPDPEQVVFAGAAAPQLLTLDQRIEALKSTGIDGIVVVPFTTEMGATPAEEFLDEVLAVAVQPLCIHVGRGFRFGRAAEGDLDTLYVWAAEHNADVMPHPLLDMDGAPVSSTRIRALISRGDVAGASELLGHPPLLTGAVRHGRGEGAALGFATANVDPVPYSAIPADGVYAGCAVLDDGSRWPAAISVGTPPTFPEARDFVEAHLIGFGGALYDRPITLEFLERLRTQRAFADLNELTAQIAADVASAREIAERYEALRGPTPEGVVEPDAFAPDVDDPIALAAAEEAVRHIPRHPSTVPDDIDDWVCVFGPHRMSTLFMDGGVSASLLTGPLEGAGIAYVWDPFPPGEAQNARPDFNWLREFRLLVEPGRAAEARAILASFL